MLLPMNECKVLLIATLESSWYIWLVATLTVGLTLRLNGRALPTTEVCLSLRVRWQALRTCRYNIISGAMVMSRTLTRVVSREFLIRPMA